MKAIKIDQELLDGLVSEARETERLRKNLNFHEQLSDPCQRLLNAMEPDSYIQPHRHCLPPRDETLLALRGRFLAILFDESGGIADAIPFGAGDRTIGVNIPGFVWHTFLALESGSLFFETKAGPYKALAVEERAAWAPTENEPGIDSRLAYWRSLV